MTVRAYMLDVAGLEQEANGPEFARLCAALSSRRQKKIEAFRFQSGKALSLGAGLLLDYGLFQYGLREREVAIAYGADEKPYLRDFPEIHFNLSHSGTLAMAVFADRETGCDVEQVKTPDMRVARRFFAPEEVKVLEEADGEAGRSKFFYRFWTLKESFLKVTGSGLRMPLDEFCIHLGPPVQVGRGGKILDYVFGEFGYPGYRAAVCVEKGGKEPPVRPEPEFLSWEQILSFQNVLNVL